MKYLALALWILAIFHFGTGDSTHRSAIDSSPQLPIQPLSIFVESVTFRSESAALSGTLRIPDSVSTVPAIILISGSGGQDRNGASDYVPNYKPFKWIADAISSVGIAVLSFDDRGVGDSTGIVEGVTTEAYAQDTEAALDFLSSDPRIDSSQIGFLGHSEGATIAVMVAARNPNVAFLISMAGPSMDGASSLILQTKRVLEAKGASSVQIEQAIEEQRESFELAVADDSEALSDYLIALYRDKLDVIPSDMTAGEREAVAVQRATQSAQNLLSPYLQFFLKYDPRADWQAVDLPILALYGGLDVQADASSHHQALKSALLACGNNQATFVVFDDANHLFQQAITGSIDEYPTLPQRFIEGFTDTLVHWLTEILGLKECQSDS